MSNKINTNLRANIDIVTAALESAVNELETTQDKLAQAEEKLARLDKMRERNFDYLVSEYAYHTWHYLNAVDDGERAACREAKIAISNVILMMYQRDVVPYKATCSDGLLLEIYACSETPTAYYHWDDSCVMGCFKSKVFVK